MTTALGQPRRSADFAAPGVRIRLSREWASGPRALVIGCNPSDADANRDDPTSRWWNRWFAGAGFGGYDAMNLYPFCTSDPAACRAKVAGELSGVDYGARDALFANLLSVVDAAKGADQVFCCWGAIAWDRDWVDHVVEEIHSGVYPWPDLWCWGLTASGAPKHPLARGRHRIEPAQRAIMWRAAR